jgi:hypothetical protein
MSKRHCCVSSNGIASAYILVALVAHDLFGKPVTTFPDHALTAVAEPYSIFNGGKTTPAARLLNTA